MSSRKSTEMTRTSQPDPATGPAPRDESPTGHARHQLDQTIHAPVRFSIIAALARVDEAEFATIRDAVEVTDSALSKQVTVLENAGYVKVTKGHVGKRPRTWLALTREGRHAFARHLETLRTIAGVEQAM